VRGLAHKEEKQVGHCVRLGRLKTWGYHFGGQLPCRRDNNNNISSREEGERGENDQGNKENRPTGRKKQSREH